MHERRSSKLRYIGGKSLLLDNINNIILSYTENVKSVVDLFSGSGVVATNFKKQGYQVVANDLLYFSYVLNRGSTALNSTPTFAKLDFDPIQYLNDLSISDTDIQLSDCFIYNNYSPNKTSNRMYFQSKNALKIDIIRITIEKWKEAKKINEDEYFYLLCSLISATPYVSNIAGVYGAYLKHWDPRSYKTLRLTPPEIIDNGVENTVYNRNSNDLAADLHADLVYIDTPYNERQYLPNYHVLETIAKYDYPDIKGITGMRDYRKEKSDYCLKAKAATAFDDLFSKLNTKYILVSYNTDGLLSTEQMTELLKKYGNASTFKLFEYRYRRYKNKIPNNHGSLKEQLYFIERK